MVKTCRRAKELSKVGETLSRVDYWHLLWTKGCSYQLETPTLVAMAGCMRPAFWEPLAYWVMKIQKHEFPEFLGVESDHVTPTQHMDEWPVFLSSQKVWMCISP